MSHQPATLSTERDPPGCGRVRMDVLVRDAHPCDEELVAAIERVVRGHAQRTGRAPALVLALGAGASASTPGRISTTCAFGRWPTAATTMRLADSGQASDAI